MSEESLDRLSAVFADFMTPEADGTPILLAADLHHALEAAGIPKELAPRLKPLMDPRKTGKITFELFAQTCLGELDQSNLKRKHVFALLSNPNGEITVETLEDAAHKMKLGVPPSDLEKMVRLCSNEAEFAELWNFLENK